MAILDNIYGAGSLLPEIIMILFIQSTVVLCKYLIVLKLFYLFNFSLKLHRIPLEFHEFSRFRQFPEYSRFFQVCGHPVRSIVIVAKDPGASLQLPDRQYRFHVAVSFMSLAISCLS